MATEDPLSGLSHEERAALAELAQARVDGRMSRREALATGGLLAGSAGLTLGGILGSTQSASADASTTDADGDIGTPTDRVDVFADGVDSVSVTTEITGDDDDALTIQPSAARQRHYILQDEIEESGAGAADFNLIKQDADFNGEINHVTKFGYNLTAGGAREESSEAQMIRTIESKYKDASGNVKTEQHWEGAYPDGTNFRVLSAVVRHTPDKQEKVNVYADSFGVSSADRNGNASSLAVNPGTGIQFNDQISTKIDFSSTQSIQAEQNTVYEVHHTYPKIRMRNVAGPPNFKLVDHTQTGDPAQIDIRSGADGPVQLLQGTSQPGTSSSPGLQLGSGGAGFYVDSNGDVVVIDTAGNTTVLS